MKINNSNYKRLAVINLIQNDDGSTEYELTPKFDSEYRFDDIEKLLDELRKMIEKSGGVNVDLQRRKM